MISEIINSLIHKAMKSRDKVRLSTLKMLSSALTNAEIEKKREKLTEEEEIKVVRSEAKKRKDAIELYVQGGAKDKAEVEKKELKILEEFLPAELSDEELEKIVTGSIEKVGAQSMTDMGKVMGLAVKEAGGRADGARISVMVRKLLG